MRTPVTAKQVRVIGGLIGSGIGATGPTGVQNSVLVAGATGGLGSAGPLGMTGPVGLAGLISAFVGMTGKKGPLGSNGYAGPTGSMGSNEIVLPDCARYYENLSGIADVGPSSVAVGCKFFYQPKHETLRIIVAIFTALVEPSLNKPMGVTIITGVGVAPESGSGGFSGEINVAASGMSIPITLVHYLNYNNSFPRPTAPFPQKWYDLAARAGTSGFDPPSGRVRNISCVIMEL